MKKLILLLSAAIILTSCAGKSEEEVAQEQALQDATHQELETAINDRDQLLALVSEISVGMDQIKRLENILAVTNTGVTDETGSQRAQILADIDAIQQALQQRREQLNQLEARLQKSKINTQQLESTIATLRGQIETQAADIETLRANLADANAQIGALNNAVDSLNTTVQTVTDERNIAQQQVIDTANELNTCYYVVASKSELKEHNVIETGFLRKTKIMEGEFDQSFFVKADKRNLTTIQLHSNKAKVLTNHPQGSYTITEENGQKVLTINYANSFWSLSNFLVIQID